MAGDIQFGTHSPRWLLKSSSALWLRWQRVASNSGASGPHERWKAVWGPWIPFSFFSYWKFLSVLVDKSFLQLTSTQTKQLLHSRSQKSCHRNGGDKCRNPRTRELHSVLTHWVAPPQQDKGSYSFLVCAPSPCHTWELPSLWKTALRLPLRENFNWLQVGPE